MGFTVGIGVDLLSVERLEEEPERLAERLLTDAEREWCGRSVKFAERLAGRFAAKEAVLKALGAGLAEGIGWKQIEILPDALGKPEVVLTGAAAERLQKIGGRRVLLSISHDGGMAIAYAQAIS